RCTRGDHRQGPSPALESSHDRKHRASRRRGLFCASAQGRTRLSRTRLLPMKLLPGSDAIAARADSGAAIRLGEPAGIAGEENRTELLLVLFKRLLAGLWLILGLVQWSAILLPPEPLFDKVSALRGAAVIFFATVNSVAAVGLWLATPWGGVIWLLCAIAQII